MNVIFFNSKTFLTRELISAFQRRSDCRTIVVNIPQYPTHDQVDNIYDKLRGFLPALVFSLNDAGYDINGRLVRLLISNNAYCVNWYHDYPLYEQIFAGRSINPHSRRIDFVSEESFIPEMQNRGFEALFLPLAVDPQFFNMKGEVFKERDLAFVGNSSLEFLDSIINKNTHGELEKVIDSLSVLKSFYYSNPGVNIREYLLNHPHLWRRKTKLSDDMLLFCMEWMIGYFYRRHFIKAVADKHKDSFTCFGDPYWKKVIDPALVSTDACYYENLCYYYRSTRINLNINRIQTRTSFNQRIFDCKASGSFIITDKRSLNEKYFKTEMPDQEIVQYDSLDHCLELIDHYLEHDNERERIALAGRKKVLKYHTYNSRVDEIFYYCKSKWGV